MNHLHVKVFTLSSLSEVAKTRSLEMLELTAKFAAINVDDEQSLVAKFMAALELIDGLRLSNAAFVEYASAAFKFKDGVIEEQAHAIKRMEQICLTFLTAIRDRENGSNSG